MKHIEYSHYNKQIHHSDHSTLCMKLEIEQLVNQVHCKSCGVYCTPKCSHTYVVQPHHTYSGVHFTLLHESGVRCTLPYTALHHINHACIVSGSCQSMFEIEESFFQVCCFLKLEWTYRTSKLQIKPQW